VRKLSVIFLSLFLSYAGIAWALEACLGHDGHSNHATAERRSDPNALVAHDGLQNPSVPVIHCTSENQEVGPAVRVASIKIPRPDKGTVLQMVSLSDAVSSALKNDLWYAVFRRLVTISLPIDLSRHLFLSVLQI
jgi:hypothetical protein